MMFSYPLKRSHVPPGVRVPQVENPWSKVIFVARTHVKVRSSLYWLPRKNKKGIPRTYSTPGSHKQQGGAGDLFYPGAPQTARGCWGPILPRGPTNSKGVLGTYSTPGPHKQQGGAGDLFYPGTPQTARWSFWDLFYPGSP